MCRICHLSLSIESCQCALNGDTDDRREYQKASSATNVTERPDICHQISFVSTARHVDSFSSSSPGGVVLHLSSVSEILFW